jgi:hypothetical protein
MDTHSKSLSVWSFYMRAAISGNHLADLNRKSVRRKKPHKECYRVANQLLQRQAQLVTYRSKLRKKLQFRLTLSKYRRIHFARYKCSIGTMEVISCPGDLEELQATNLPYRAKAVTHITGLRK